MRSGFMFEYMSISSCGLLLRLSFLIAVSFVRWANERACFGRQRGRHFSSIRASDKKERRPPLLWLRKRRAPCIHPPWYRLSRQRKQLAFNFGRRSKGNERSERRRQPRSFIIFRRPRLPPLALFFADSWNIAVRTSIFAVIHASSGFDCARPLSRNEHLFAATSCRYPHRRWVFTSLVI